MSNIPWFTDMALQVLTLERTILILFLWHQTLLSSPDTFWFSRQEYWRGCHFLLQWAMFHQNSSLWPVHLGWPCIAWLLISWSYARYFAMTSLWSLYLPVLYHKHDQCLRLIGKIQKRIHRRMNITKIYPKQFILSHLEIKSLQILLE